MDVIYGIDFGTTYSSVALLKGARKPEMVPNEDGDYITPSVIFFDPSSDAVIVGKKAKQFSAQYPNNTASLVKREMGKVAEKVRKNRFGEYTPFYFRDRIWAPEELSAIILKQLVSHANLRTGLDVRDVVITVPAYFGSLERQATRNAALVAGLNVLDLLNEPTAIAITYGALEARQGETVLVFDLGGGTLDVTTMKVSGPISSRTIDVLATDGDRKLGGADWDDKIVSWVLEQFEEKYGLNLIYQTGLEKDKTLATLVINAEQAKIALTTQHEVPLQISYGGQVMQIILNRSHFEEITRNLNAQLLFFCKRVLQGVPPSSIDTLILAGSMSQSQPVREEIEKWFCRPAKYSVAVDPKLAVAFGAALYARKFLAGDDIETVTPRESVVVHNVIPRSLGIIAYDDQDREVVDRLLLANHPYPADVTKEYMARKGGAREIRVRIVEGDSNEPNLNDQLGHIILSLDRAVAQGEPLQVRFTYGSDGILNVELRDRVSGKFIKSTIHRQGAFVPSGRLSI
jgi:molecular chaperone DnaK